MTIATTNNVTKLYIAVFKRAPDGMGLDYWVNSSALKLEQIAQSFFDQPETQDKYAETGNQAFIETIYRNTLGREGEAAGVAYWLHELENGNISRDQMILAVINGAQGEDAQLLENRTEVGIHFAEYNRDDAPDAFQAIEETTFELATVELVKQWIDGVVIHQPGPYPVLDDGERDYELTGSDRDDVLSVEAFKSAIFDGGKGSDTLDFQDYAIPGIRIDLVAGNGLDGMQILNVENIRATPGDDTLIGNDDPNILISMGGADTVDGGAGDDRFLFENMTDIAGGSINGGAGTDILEITGETAIQIDRSSFARVANMEILQIGYEEEGVPAVALITLGTGVVLDQFQEIRGTESYTHKGVLTPDVIQSAGNLDLRGITLTSIEELRLLSDGAALAIDAANLVGIKTISGPESGTAYLYVNVAEGKTFDLDAIELNNISLWDVWLV